MTGDVELEIVLPNALDPGLDLGLLELPVDFEMELALEFEIGIKLP